MNKLTVLVFWIVTLMCNVSLANVFYVSSISGNDSFSGTNKEPFKTISKALLQMQSGDICYVKQGVYRERITVKTDNISIKAYQNDFVLITGSKLNESNFEPYTLSTSNKPCFRIKYTGELYDLFVNGDMVNMARFPNKTVPMNSNLDWARSYITGPEGNIEFKEGLPRNFIDYDDGYYIGIHTSEDVYNRKGIAAWTTFSAPIVKTDSGLLILDKEKSSSGYVGGSNLARIGLGYILGARAALDTYNEWYRDKDYIYFILPEGVDANTAKIEMRTLLYVIQLTGKGVTLENLNFKAGSMLISGDNNKIDNCTFRYITPFINNPEPGGGQSKASQWGLPETCSAGIYVSGNNNTIVNSYFAHSWSSGITLDGNSNLIENSFIEDVNWIGRRNAGINSYGEDNIVRFCTIQNTGATCLEGGNGNWLKKYAIRNIWEHNFFKDACRLVCDEAFIYVNHQRGNSPASNTIIRYNIGENNRGPEKEKWSPTCVGLYVDNNSSGYILHNNIIINAKEGFRYNDFADGDVAGKNINVYNNTFYLCDKSGGIGMNSKSGLYDAEVQFFNNVSIGPGSGLVVKYGEENYGDNNFGKLDVNSVTSPNYFNFKLQGEALKKGIPVKIYDPKMDPDASGINYIGAIDPTKELFKAGSTKSRPDFSFEKNLLTK